MFWLCTFFVWLHTLYRSRLAGPRPPWLLLGSALVIAPLLLSWIAASLSFYVVFSPSALVTRPNLKWARDATERAAVIAERTDRSRCPDGEKWLRDGQPIGVAVTLSGGGYLAWAHRFRGCGQQAVILTRPAANKLGMQYHLQGILRQSGDRLRLNVSLSERFIGQQIWAEHYEYQLVDAFSVQDEIARQIASAVANQLYATESASARLQSPKNLSAWQCIVRALLLISTRNKAEVKAAEELLTRAISIDPKSASAYSLHSFVSTLRVHLGWQTRRQALPHALRTAEKARALNPDEPWAHLALGYALTHSRPDEALEPLEHGLTLDPNLSMARFFVHLFGQLRKGFHACPNGGTPQVIRLVGPRQCRNAR
jgi:hypothetical protein